MHQGGIECHALINNQTLKSLCYNNSNSNVHSHSHIVYYRLRAFPEWRLRNHYGVHHKVMHPQQDVSTPTMMEEDNS